MKTNIFIKKACVLIFIATFLTASLTPTLGFPEYNLENIISERSSEYKIENLVSINSFDSKTMTALGGKSNDDNDCINISLLADPHMVDRALPKGTYDDMIDDIQNDTHFGKLDFWVALGDEAISKVGCYEAWETLQEWYYSRIPTSLLLAQGNHDVYVYTGNGGYPTGWAARPYDDNLWMSLNETNDIRATHAIYQQGILFLFIGDKGEHRILPYGQKVWLEHLTSLYPDSTTIIFSHEGQRDDAHTWPSAGSYGFYNDVDWWRDFFNRNPQIELWVNGHGHHNSDITTVNYNGDPLSFILLEAFQTGCDDKIGYLNINETEMRFRVWDVSSDTFTNDWLITSSPTFNSVEKGWVSFPMFLEDNESQWFDNKILSPNIIVQLVGWHEREMFQNPNLTWFDQHQDFDWLYFGNDLEEQVRQWNGQTIPYGQDGEPYGVMSIDTDGFVTFPHKNSVGYAPWDTYSNDLAQGGNCYSHIGCSFEMFGQQPPGAKYDVLITAKTDNGTGHLNLSMNCSTENDVYTTIIGSEQNVINVDVTDTYRVYKGTFTIPKDNISIINGKIECTSGTGVDWYNISYISIMRNASGNDTEDFHLRLGDTWYNSSGLLLDCECVNYSVNALDLMNKSKVDVFAKIVGNKKGFARLIYETPVLMARNGRFRLNDISQNGNIYNITITDQLSAVNPHCYFTPLIYDYGNLAVTNGSIITTNNNNSFSKTLMTPTTLEITYGPLLGIPVVSQENPVDGEDFVPITLSNLSFNISDPESDDMNFTVGSNPFIGGGSGKNVSDGRFNVSVTGLTYDTTYYWWVNVSDGTNDSNTTFSFTTAPSEPVVSNEIPIDNGVDVDLCPLLSIDIVDYQGDDVDWWIKSNASGSWQVLANDTLVCGNGTVSTSNTSYVNQYETVYWWSINVTDTGSNSWNNKTYNFVTGIEPGGWYNNGWLYRRVITVNHSNIGSSLHGFPMLVSITDSDLGNHSENDGSDILFTDYFTNKLSHEIEMFNSSNGNLICWVNISSIDSTEDTVIYLYYGNPDCSNQENPENVWDLDYRLVQHLNETSGVHSDSTTFGNDCSIHGSVSMDTDGMIDGADDFDGSTGYGEVASSSSIDVPLVTVELWAKSDLSGPTYSGNAFLINKQNTEALTYGFFMRSDNDSIFFNIRLDGSEDISNRVKANDLLDTNWHHYVGTYDGSQIRLYVDGALQTDALSLSGSIDTDNSDILRIGNHPSNVGYFDGIIDEIRISSVSRNSSWIYASYKNQLDPSSFYNVSEEEIKIIQEPILTSEQPLDNSTNVNISPELQVKIADYQGDDVDWWIKSNASGVWKVLANTTLVGGNGTVSTSNTSDIDQYETMYWWSVNATDPMGSGNWTNMTFSFTTGVKTIFNPFNQGWLYRRQIKINHTFVTENLSGFPVLIEIIGDDGLTSNIQNNGNDIIFMDGIGAANQLPHEIEYFNSTEGNLICWVNISNLSSMEDTVFYMYYGNSEVDNCENVSGVWDDNYILVQHFNETSGTHYDSSGNANDGSPLNGVIQDASGITDGADSFDGDNDYIQVTDSTSLDTISTIELWLKPGKTYDSSNQVNEGFLSKRKTSADFDGFTFLFYGGTTTANRGKILLSNDPGSDTTLSTFSNRNTWNKDEWYQVTAVLDGVSGKMFVNGIDDSDTGLTTETNSALYDFNTNLWIGVRVGSTLEYFNGTIDEVRLSNIARSSDWIATEYANRNNLSGFLNIGNEESLKPTFSNENPSDGAVDVSLQPILDILINDTYGDDVDWWIKSNASGVWKVLANDTLVGGNGTVSTSNTSDMDQYETMYWWSVNATDPMGSGNWTNITFSFTTEFMEKEYYKKITINHSYVEGNLSNYPVLISVTDSDLANHTQSTGYDIKFTKTNNPDSYQYSHEIEYYNHSQGVLVCWVNITEISSINDTVFYMHYGNKTCGNQQDVTGVWDSNYRLVQHFEETSGLRYDSTNYGNNGSIHGGVSSTAGGLVDGADDFDGSSGYIEVSSDASIDVSQITLEGWFKSDITGPSYSTTGFMINRQMTSPATYGLFLRSNSDKVTFSVRIDGSEGTLYDVEADSTLDTNWHHYFGIYDGSEVKLFIDGVLQSDTETVSGSIDTDNSDVLRIGNHPADSSYFDGLIDELRISNIARNISWAKTTYNNHLHPTDFCQFESEQIYQDDNDPPLINSVIDAPDPQEVNGYVNITCDVTDNVGVDDVWVNISGPGGFTPVNTTMSEGSYYYNASYSIVGIYSYFIWANDTSGNSNISTGHSFTIQDTTSPIIVDNTVGPAYTGNSFTFNASVTDNVDTPSVFVEYWYNGGGHTNVSMVATGLNNYFEHTITVEDTDDVLYYIISANDTGPNWNNTGQLDVGSVIDNDLPEITDVTADPASQETGGYVNITCNVDDNVGVNIVKVNITYPDSSYHNETMLEGSYYWNASYTLLGTYYFFIWANDTSGNSNMSSVSSFVIQDSTLPVISNVDAQPDPQEVGGFVNITCDVSDNVDVDEVWVNITYPDSSYHNETMLEGSYYYNTTYIQVGTYDYFIWANDTSGNANISTVYSFSIVDLSAYTAISLKEQWNLISLPFNQSINKTGIYVSYNGHNYTWDDAVVQVIILGFIYNWSGSSQCYSTAEVLDSGYGYWIWSYCDCTLLIDENANDDEYITTLENQWNIVGVPSDELLWKNNLIICYNNTDYSWYEATTNNNEEGEPLILSFIYGWNSNIQNYALSDEFIPGYGYWMYAYYNCILKKVD